MDYDEKSEYVEPPKVVKSATGTLSAGRRKKRSVVKTRKVSKKRLRRTVGRKRFL